MSMCTIVTVSEREQSETVQGDSVSTANVKILVL